MTEWKSKADWKNPSWKYIPASATDISKTIARVKREMKELAEKEAEETKHKITQIRKAAGK